MTPPYRRHLALPAAALIGALTLAACSPRAQEPEPLPQPPTTPENTLVPEGFELEQVATGLTFPTSATWDDQGRLWVAEAGGGFQPEQLEPSRLLRLENGSVAETIELSDSVVPPVVGLTFHEGSFYITHRDPADLTGAVSRVAMDGSVEQILTGF